MTNTIVNLDREQTRERRREQLENHLYDLIDLDLMKLRDKGLTKLWPAEAGPSAERFARLLLSLPEEGIEDAFDDLKKEAKGMNDAMIISVLAASIIGDQRGSLPASVWQFVATHIFARWDVHEILWSMLQAAARRWDSWWMGDKKTYLLTWGLNEDNLDGASAVVSDIVDYCEGLTADAIQNNLLPLKSIKGKYGQAVDEQINRLEGILKEKTTTQVNVEAGGVNIQNVEQFTK